MIRPPDPELVGQTTLTYMTDASSAVVVRHLLHLAFRDCATVLDLTYGAGRFWQEPEPPGITLSTNDIDRAAMTTHHLDYRNTRLPNATFDLVIFDPPHTADNGETGHFKQRYGGVVKGNLGLFEDITQGAAEAWRLAKKGLLVKVADCSHGGELLMESYWVQQQIPMQPYAIVHTVKKQPITDPKHRIQRVPKSNGAVYFAFRKDSHKHKNWDALYEREHQLDRMT